MACVVGGKADYRKAYEELNKAFWEYDAIYNDAHVQLLMKICEIESELHSGKQPLVLAPPPPPKRQNEATHRRLPCANFYANFTPAGWWP